MKNLQPKPWVVTSVKLLVGALLVLCSVLIVLVLSAHDKRIKALEAIPTVVVPVVTPTPTIVPTATPTATLKRVVPVVTSPK